MNRKRIYHFLIIIIAIIIIVLLWRKFSSKKPQAGMMAPVVIVSVPKIQDVEDYYEFTGNTAAVEQVDIKARVEGVLDKIDFTDGSDINEGDLLFTIQPDKFEAKRDQAKAQLLSSQAELARAQLDYERVEEALRTNAVSKQDVSTKKSQRDQAQAAVMSAAANLRSAELDLDYTRVTSPIAGRVSRRFVDIGNLVGAGEQTLLATVVRMHPMYVYFNASEDTLQQYFLAHRPDSSAGNSKFYVGLPSQDDYPYEGVLDYIDNTVDQSTGTIVIRGEIPNSQNQLLPGMFVRIRVPTGIKKDAVLIEERAVNSDIGGKFVLLVDPNNTVQKNYVQLGKNVGDMRVVESGITGGQTYIVSGLGGFTFARPGTPVTPKTEEEMKAMPSPMKGSNAATH
ncbi:MAG: efflux RND transporter periplasmic adaptor subunit [Phycisphaerae bacterium]|nr:efflux RND transporter periplasmic adaptor subunit [Phycisphaerae bacterium]